MGKNVRLANIYIKIYNKRPLTMDDLAFLAKYDRECFEKTCQNLIYNIPETKTLMQSEPAESNIEKKDVVETTEIVEAVTGEVVDLQAEMIPLEKSVEIEALLENLKNMEGQEFGLQKLNIEHVKHLLGSLFMEMLFPHNDRDKTFQMGEEENRPTFNKKA